MESRTKIAVSAAVVVAGALCWPRQKEPLPTPPLAEPAQTETDPQEWSQYGCEFTTRHFYQGRVRILSRQNYYLEEATRVSRTDLVFAWGVMALPELYQNLDISQSGRWFFYSFDPAKVDPEQIKSLSANTHTIPATPEIARTIGRIRAGDLVDFEGFLVNVSHNKNEPWRSSISRTDTGAGACEVLYFTKLEIVK